MLGGKKILPAGILRGLKFGGTDYDNMEHNLGHASLLKDKIYNLFPF